MTLNRFSAAGAALVLALIVAGPPAEAGQRDSHGRDRNGRASRGQNQSQSQSQNPNQGQSQNPNQGQSQQRASGPQQESVTPAPRPQGAPGQIVPAPAPGNAAQRHYAVPRPVAPAVRGNAPYGNAPYYGTPGYNNHGAYNNRGAYRNTYPYQPYRYYPYPVYGYAPRPIHPAYYPHYYGPGGHFSVYFGWGNGYLYGSPWTGPVYGYAAPAVSGRPVYYGDVRLLVEPRNAEVYVDGYYAGIVDDFDGTFQRLTIEAGPHHIELAASGAEPRVFDVYVDPSRTVDIHADLFR